MSLSNALLLLFSVLSLIGLGFFFALGVKGLGGVFSNFRKTSSSEGPLDTEDFPTQALLDLYAVTGELVIHWGQLEASMQATIAMVYHDFGGKEVEPKLPVPFLRRMKFLKECFNKRPELAQFAEDARAIRGKAKELSFVREYLSHGYLSLFDPETGIYTFRRLDPDEDDSIHVESIFKATVQELLDKTAQIGSLCDLSHKLNRRLADACPRLNQGNKTGSCN